MVVQCLSNAEPVKRNKLRRILSYTWVYAENHAKDVVPTIIIYGKQIREIIEKQERNITGKTKKGTDSEVSEIEFIQNILLLSRNMTKC